jgi:putative endonuclease
MPFDDLIDIDRCGPVPAVGAARSAGNGGVASAVRSGRRPCDARRARGRMAHASGMAAEASVERHYLARGLRLAARRWRGGGGEIDLVLRDGPVLVFVEIKQAASFEIAAQRLGSAQIARLRAAVACFVEGEPIGGLTDVRFDVALVDGTGEVRIIENALAA